MNHSAKKSVVEKAEKLLGDLEGKKIGILGLAFKPNTDDMRFAPSIEIVEWLRQKGAEITAYDPQSMEKAKKIITGITFSEDSYTVTKEADLLIVITDWNEFKELDFNKIKENMKSYNIIDARNIYDPEKMKSLGFKYIGVGR